MTSYPTPKLVLDKTLSAALLVVLSPLFAFLFVAMGLDALSWYNEAGVIPAAEQGVAPQFAYARANTIFGGSNEIQKNIIAKWILGLPAAG